MKRIAILMLGLALCYIPLVQAEGGYLGAMIAQVSAAEDDFDIETGNLGIVVGNVMDSGFGIDGSFGIEGFFLVTVAEDENSDLDADVSTEGYGILGFYRTPGDFYVTAKAGWAIVSADIDFNDGGRSSDSQSGLAYGLGVGASIGGGDLELTYMVLPEFDTFDGADVDIEIDTISLSYLWYF